MKLLTNHHEIEFEFNRLISKHEKFLWSVAWAGVNFKQFEKLVANKSKIDKLIVGIHFYQTHPDFIRTFMKNSKVRFVMQPEGTFHPKIYLFYTNDNNWDLIVGSANFTSSAFQKNSEVCTSISSMDIGSSVILNKTIPLFDEYWKIAKPVTESEYQGYLVTWQNQKSKINSLSGTYGGTAKIGKPMHLVPVAKMTWEEFIKRVKNEPNHYPQDRVDVIAKCQELFKKSNHFNELKTEERKFIAGVPNKLESAINLDWGYFGSMKGAGVFKNLIIKNDLNISLALDEIPLNGQITKANYDAFVKKYTKSFNGIGTATRLLAMKRPDTFVCFVSKNKQLMTKEFDIQQSNMDYDRYWDEIIERIFDSEWWKNPKPKNELESSIMKARAAFLDALYYKGK